MQRWGRCLLKGGATRYAYDECIQLDAPYKIGPPNAETETHATRRPAIAWTIDATWCGEEGEGEKGGGRQQTTHLAGTRLSLGWPRPHSACVCVSVCVKVTVN